jgi:hypothetical protein
LGSLAVYNGNPWLRSKIKPMEWRSIVNPAFFSLILKSRISYCCNQIVLTYPTATACFFRSYHTWTAVWVYSPQLWRFERIQNKKANFEIHILNSILLTPLSRLNFSPSLYISSFKLSHKAPTLKHHVLNLSFFKQFWKNSKLVLFGYNASCYIGKCVVNAHISCLYHLYRISITNQYFSTFVECDLPPITWAFIFELHIYITFDHFYCRANIYYALSCLSKEPFLKYKPRYFLFFFIFKFWFFEFLSHFFYFFYFFFLPKSSPLCVYTS